DLAGTAIYTLSLHDALPISIEGRESVVTAIIKESTTPSCAPLANNASATGMVPKMSAYIGTPISVASTTPKGLLLPSRVDTHPRSEEHTSELQSRENLVCRL